MRIEPRRAAPQGFKNLFKRLAKRLKQFLKPWGAARRGSTRMGLGCYIVVGCHGWPKPIISAVWHRGHILNSGTTGITLPC